MAYLYASFLLTIRYIVILVFVISKTAQQAALMYKELWQVEQVFRDMKSVLDTRTIFQKLDETMRGHIFCGFLALAIVAKRSEIRKHRVR
jgi:transposase